MVLVGDYFSVQLPPLIDTLSLSIVVGRSLRQTFSGCMPTPSLFHVPHNAKKFWIALRAVSGDIAPLVP